MNSNPQKETPYEASNSRSVHEMSVSCRNRAPDSWSLPPLRHADGAGDQGHAAHVERSARSSRQGSDDVHRGEGARRVGPDPSSQCTWVYLRTGGLHCNAGGGWKRSDVDTWTDLL